MDGSQPQEKTLMGLLDMDWPDYVANLDSVFRKHSQWTTTATTGTQVISNVRKYTCQELHGRCSVFSQTGGSSTGGVVTKNCEKKYSGGGAASDSRVIRQKTQGRLISSSFFDSSNATGMIIENSVPLNNGTRAVKPGLAVVLRENNHEIVSAGSESIVSPHKMRGRFIDTLADEGRTHTVVRNLGDGEMRKRRKLQHKAQQNVIHTEETSTVQCSPETTACWKPETPVLDTKDGSRPGAIVENSLTGLPGVSELSVLREKAKSLLFGSSCAFDSSSSEIIIDNSVEGRRETSSNDSGISAGEKLEEAGIKTSGTDGGAGKAASAPCVGFSVNSRIYHGFPRGGSNESRVIRQKTQGRLFSSVIHAESSTSGIIVENSVKGSPGLDQESRLVGQKIHGPLVDTGLPNASSTGMIIANTVQVPPLVALAGHQKTPAAESNILAEEGASDSMIFESSMDVDDESNGMSDSGYSGKSTNGLLGISAHEKTELEMQHSSLSASERVATLNHHESQQLLHPSIYKCENTTCMENRGLIPKRIWTIQKTPGGQFHCPECSKGVGDSFLKFYVHMQTHGGGGHTCPGCKYNFTRSDNLQRHLRRFPTHLIESDTIVM